MIPKNYLEQCAEEEDFYGQYPGDNARDPRDEFCTGPNCHPVYDGSGKQVAVDCRDCALCNRPEYW
jgi:hypothetical protein